MRNSMMLLVLAFSVTACTKPEATAPVAPSANGAPAVQAPAPAPDSAAIASPARVAAPVLSKTGYGPVMFGDTLSAIERKLEEKSTPLGERDPACSSVRFGQLPGARFMVEKGVITRADADAGTPNELGVAVGDTLAQAKQKYSAIEVGPHKYLPAGHYLTARSADAKAAIVMEEDGKHITKIRAGLEPAVSYVEVCL